MIQKVRHTTVYHDINAWAAVPANNGGNGPAWQWGDEILAGFTRGVFKEPSDGHQCDYDEPFESWLARSTDGGESWTAWKPIGYAGEVNGDVAAPVPRPIDFSADGFVVRVEGAGYHGNLHPRWFFSSNRGAEWSGPHDFCGLLEHPELHGKEFTARTGYVVEGRHSMKLFLTAREKPSDGELTVMDREKAFLAETSDGGKSFSFVSWIVPWDDPYRAAMPSSVKISEHEIVTALRRKSTSDDRNWIDCYQSPDDGKNWVFLSRVCETEHSGTGANGNPPALIRMSDGRLCIVYGNRTERSICLRISTDDGASWSDPYRLRDDFHSVNGWPDLGYPRVFERNDGSLVAAYFWCTETQPQTHIESTVFEL